MKTFAFDYFAFAAATCTGGVPGLVSNSTDEHSLGLSLWEAAVSLNLLTLVAAKAPSLEPGQASVWKQPEQGSREALRVLGEREPQSSHLSPALEELSHFLEKGNQ